MTDRYRPPYRRRLAAATIVWLFASASAAAQVILDATPGGVVEIPLGAAEQPRPEAFFGQHRTLVTQFGSRWVTLVGLPLDIVPGTYVMQARLGEDTEMTIEKFTVYPRRVRDGPVVDLSELPFDEPAVDFSWRDSLDTEFPLATPVPVEVEPLFGRYRRVSESSSEYVDFVSFRIETDMSIRAPGGGQVAAVESGAAGLYVWIDHGMALFTCVGPLTRTPLRPSDTIKAGESIGKVVLESADEPVVLYWSVYLNGTAVNPLLVSDTVAGPGRSSIPGSGG